MNSLSYTDLVREFRELGIKDGDVLLVHSSLKSLGYVEGGADCVVSALLDTIGAEGTLIVPTLTGKREDRPESPPIFDVLQTSCWTGIIPETVRKMRKAIRSLHPTHSAAAAGKQKEFITSGHEFSKTPCDETSPYYLNAIGRGHILLIGVDQESNTSIHSCEEMAKVPYHLQKEETEMFITGYEGKNIRVVNRLHQWEKPETDFNKLDGLYRRQGIMTIGKIGNSVARYIDADKMFDFTINLLERDNSFLLK